MTKEDIVKLFNCVHKDDITDAKIYGVRHGYTSTYNRTFRFASGANRTYLLIYLRLNKEEIEYQHNEYRRSREIIIQEEIENLRNEYRGR